MEKFISLIDFNVEKAKEGAELMTRGYEKVTIISYNGSCKKHPIVALIHSKDDEGHKVDIVEEYSLGGCPSSGVPTHVMMLLGNIIEIEEIESMPWKDNKDAHWHDGYSLNFTNSYYHHRTVQNDSTGYNVFISKKHAKSASAMARIGQLMKYDKRYGGIVTNDEWRDDDIPKYTIFRNKTSYDYNIHYSFFNFLAFHTEEQRDLFIKENEQLVKEYLMID